MRAQILVLSLACAPLLAQERAIPTPKSVDWVELGPAPITTGPFTGRVAAIACSATEPGRYYVGGADGGVWRSDDGGTSWIAVGDALPTTAIGALAVDPNDDDVVYAGMGEANFAYHSRYGMGFARSRDAGRTWAVSGEAMFAGRCFSRIRVHPQDTSILFASTTHAGGFPAKQAARDHPLRGGPLGVFRSDDQGSTWTQLSDGLPTNVSATDVALDPVDPRIVYAAIGDIFGDAANGIYRSTNGGDTFTKLGGFPGSAAGRLTIAVAPSDGGAVIYVSVVNASSSTGGSASTRGVYRSFDRGATWSSINAPSHHATYGWYLSTCAVAPGSPGTLIVGGLTCHRTVNGGGTWNTVTPPHVDLHALEFDADGRLLCGNDGGIHRSNDLGSSWSTLNNNLGLIQFYAGISLDPNDPAVVYGGTQDNGSVVRSGSTLR